MKEILIIVKYDENEFSAKMETKGFDESNGPLNSLEIIGVLENIKQQELNKLID